MMGAVVHLIRRLGRSGRAASVCAALLAIACDVAPDRTGDDPRSLLVLAASDVRIIGASDTIAEYVDLEVLPDGDVWVLNSVEPLFVAFDADGTITRAHGRRGGGPTEFQTPAGFVRGGIDDGVWIYDQGRHTFVEVSHPDDAARPSFAVPAASVPPGSVAGGIGWALAAGRPVRTARLGDGVIAPRRADLSDDGVLSYWHSVWAADLVALRPDADSARLVVALADVLGDPSPHFDLAGTSLPFPLWYRLWDVCSGDVIRVYDRVANVVRGFTADGVELEPTPLPPPRRAEITPAEFARATFDVAVLEIMGAAGDAPPVLTPADSARITERILSRVDADPAQLANLLPRYTDFRCDENGTQWLQPFDVASGALGGGAVWLRISATGQTREVQFPDGFQPYRFEAGRVWGVQRDAFDVGSLAWIELPVED